MWNVLNHIIDLTNPTKWIAISDQNEHLPSLGPELKRRKVNQNHALRESWTVRNPICWDFCKKQINSRLIPGGSLFVYDYLDIVCMLFKTKLKRLKLCFFVKKMARFFST